MRLFIAFDTDEDIQAALKRAQKSMGRLPGVKWAAPEAMHITVKFIGEFPAEKVGDVLEVMREAVKGVRPFEFAVRRLGWFPPGRRPRVVWAGLEDDGGALGLVAGRLERGMAALGVAPEGRAFKAHLTLGRARGEVESAGLEAAFAKVADREFGRHAAKELVLYMSELYPSGAVYTRMGAAALREEGQEEN